MNLEKEKDEDFPSYRIGAQVHDHEARIRLLERDSEDIKKTLSDLTLTLESFIKNIESKFIKIGVDVHNDLAAHEKAEFINQQRIMTYLIYLLLSVLGAGLYLILQQLLKLP